MTQAAAMKGKSKLGTERIAHAVQTPPLVRSMTGFGRAAVEDKQRVTAEIRSVNGRFLKLSVKVMGRYGALEDRIKTLIGELGIKRGSVDVSLYFNGASNEGAYGINEAAFKQYVTQARALGKKYKLKGDVSLNAILPLPDTVKRLEMEEDIEVVWASARKALGAAAQDFNAMREREGVSMVADVRAQLAKLAEHRAAIALQAPEALKHSIEKFRERIAKLLEQARVAAPVNPEWLEREIVLMSDRTDVAEELARLQSHFEQMEETLAAGGETGKKLDFLTQELFR
jgi:uncharacterized protein (TIGR00255 family)